MLLTIVHWYSEGKPLLVAAPAVMLVRLAVGSSEATAAFDGSLILSSYNHLARILVFEAGTLIVARQDHSGVLAFGESTEVHSFLGLSALPVKYSASHSGMQAV